MGGICSTRKTRNKAHTNESQVTNGCADEPLQATAVGARAEVTSEVQPEVQPEIYAPEGGTRELRPEKSETKQSGIEEYERTFTAYYAKLCNALCAPITQILPELVSSEVITVHEAEEILSERTSIEKAQALLSKHIFRGISAGCPEVLEYLLSVMWHSDCSDHTCKALSEEICLKLNISPGKNTSSILVHRVAYRLDKYQEYLKYKYKALKLTSPDEMLDCSSPEYINLTLTIDGKSHNSSTLSEIFNIHHNENNVILIEGGPGMGKSTLAINVCKCWAEGELLQAYHAVILLPLREKEIQDAKEVKDLLLTLDDQIRQDVLKEITSEHSQRICFIFEGFDELPIDLQKSSLFRKINTYLPTCTLVYTARPEACGELRHIATRVVTIKGFTEESVDKYILKTFQDEQEKAHDLKAQINSKPWIRNILHVPINVAIVCLIFFHSAMSVLPDTLTELYNLLILRLVLRYIKMRTPNKAKIEILRSLNDLPPEISSQFKQLCSIASVGILQRKMIFSSQDLQEMDIAAENIDGMGLLLVAPRVLVYGRERSYNFLHLTVQEFCAAWHLSKSASKEEIKIYCNFNNLQMMMLFYSGITGLRNRAILDNVMHYKQLDSKITGKQAHNVLKYLYEAHNSEACQIIGDHLGGNVHLNNHKTIAMHTSLSDMMHVINYFITEYKGKLTLIDMSPPNYVVADELELLANSLVKRRELQYNTDGVVLKVSFVVPPKITNKFYPSLSLAVENYPIAELYIGGIIQEGVLSLQFILQLLCLSNTLTVLDISRIGLEGILSFPNCGTISLCDLRLTRCNINLVVDEIGKLMSYCKSLESVNLSYSRLSDHEVEKLVEHLTSINTLQNLDLSGNNITAVGIGHLRRLIATDPLTLTSMELSYNPLKDEGVCLLLQTLKAPMEHIGFSWVEMTSSSCQSVANALHKVKSINLTVPDGPEVTGLEIGNMRMLESIALNGLNDRTHHEVISSVKQNSSIKTLALSYSNCKADECVKDLCQFIKDNKSIVELNIYCYTASPQILLPVADSLATNNYLKYFCFTLVYEVGIHDHKDIKETVLEFLDRVSLVCVLEELILAVEGDYSNSDCDPYFDLECKINIDYVYHQNIEQRVKEINKIRSIQKVVNPLKVTVHLY